MMLIRSTDIVSGYNYNGYFDMNTSLNGTYTLNYHWVEDGDIPWIYDGYNVLYVTRDSTGSMNSISFGNSDSDDSGDITTLLQTAFSSLAYPTVGVTYDSVTKLHTVTFSESVTLNWSNDNSSAKYVFGIDDDYTGLSFSFDMSFVEVRPKFLQVNIDSVSSVGISSGNDRPTLLISLYDDLCVGQTITYDSADATDELGISFYKLGLGSSPVPMNLKWLLSFTSS